MFTQNNNAGHTRVKYIQPAYAGFQTCHILTNQTLFPVRSIKPEHGCLDYALVMHDFSCLMNALSCRASLASRMSFMQGFSCLMNAAFLGHKATVDLLLADGADVNSQTEDVRALEYRLLSPALQ